MFFRTAKKTSSRGNFFGKRRAKFEALEPRCMLTVVISELHYHPDNSSLADEDDQEFIEIFNTGDSTFDLSGVQIADFAVTPYAFDDGSSLEPGEYLVVARNPAIFTSIYGTDINLASTGYNNKNLSNGGEKITLLSASGTVIESFTYDDEGEWPTAPDGNGPSLEIVDPYGDPTDPANWRASAETGGSPGTSGNTFLLGDYDQSGTVDQDDLADWSDQFGQISTPAGNGADGNLNGVVDGGDFLIWQRNIGSTSSIVSTLQITEANNIQINAIQVNNNESSDTELIETEQAVDNLLTKSVLVVDDAQQPIAIISESTAVLVNPVIEINSVKQINNNALLNDLAQAFFLQEIGKTTENQEDHAIRKTVRNEEFVSAPIPPATLMPHALNDKDPLDDITQGSRDSRWHTTIVDACFSQLDDVELRKARYGIS